MEIEPRLQAAQAMSARWCLSAFDAGHGYWRSTRRLPLQVGFPSLGLSRKLLLKAET